MQLRESEFERAIERFYEAAAAPSLWPTALEAVADACGAMGANLLPVGPGEHPVVCSPAMRAYIDDFVGSGWLSTNPYMRRGMELTAAGWQGLITSEDMLTPEEAASDAYVNEHRLPCGLGPEVGMVLAAAEQMVVPITVDRRVGEEPFSRSEVQQLNRLMRALQPAARLAISVGFAASQRIADTLLQGGSDIALLAASGRVIHMSSGFARHIGEGLTLTQGHLGSKDADANAQLSASVAKVVRLGAASERIVCSVVLPRPPRRGLVARLTPVVGAAQDIFMLTRAILVICDPDTVRMGKENDAALAAMGLTPAEIVLAKHIAAGDDLKSIALSHAVALETVRARLKSVFAKTHTHRQAELAILLARLSR